MSEKTVSDAVIRVLLDATEDVLGQNGLKALLNYGGMIHLFENKPPFSMEKNYTDDDFTALSANYYKLLGTSGTKAVFRMVGMSTVKHVLSTGLMDSVKEFKGEERLFKALELYALATGRGKVTREGNTIVYDNPQCTACKNQKSDSPFCTIYNGMIDAYIKWSGIDGVQAVETKCMAMGDDTCRFEVLPKK